MVKFDGRKIRDKILAELKPKFVALDFRPVLAVVWIGDDLTSAKYIEQKQRAAEYLDIHFDIIKYDLNAKNSEIIEKIKELNLNPEISGILVQLPIPENLDRQRIIAAIVAEKDVDALRFCLDLACTFRPPVILGILRAIKDSGVNLEKSKVTVVGRGFLVGEPLIRILRSKVAELRVADDQTPFLSTLTVDADVIISATGQPNLIKLDMVKERAILIDAGVAELGGKLSGDIDPNSYQKSAFYTPVPGGIGPMTVVFLFENLLAAVRQREK